MSSQYNVYAIKQETKGDPERYVIIDATTRVVLDDADGFGYTSATKAHNAYAFKQKKTISPKTCEQKLSDQYWIDNPAIYSHCEALIKQNFKATLVGQYPYEVIKPIIDAKFDTDVPSIYVKKAYNRIHRHVLQQRKAQ